MLHAFRVKWMVAVVALCTALGAGALMAQDKMAAPGAGGGVTFQNESSQPVQLFARYGAGDSCEHGSNQVELHVAPGSSSTVDSGDSKVCFCLAVPDRNTCPTGWTQVKPGGKRVFR
ncbi:MAG TPA: hypothetical protein VKY89_02925 [Thermoanaerobaculia bacterium]|jgi:hypothetical protein|nr:hypothetical protein [Thermoanaerobaculia bacterium]